MTMLALVRDVTPSIVHCELTHLERTPIDFGRAAGQHRAYVEALSAAGCEIERLPVEPELPDAVFVEDTAVVLDELAVITRPGAESRRLEVESVAGALARHRPIHRIMTGTLDGGDVLLVGRTLYVGRTPRTNPRGFEQLGLIVGAAGYEVKAIEVRGCLHLKSAVTAVADDTLIINPEWVDPAAFPGFKFIQVDPTEPFAGNTLRLGPMILQAAEFPKTRQRLSAAGYKTKTVPASELAKAEGGVTCCSLLLKI